MSFFDFLFTWCSWYFIAHSDESDIVSSACVFVWKSGSMLSFRPFCSFTKYSCCDINYMQERNVFAGINVLNETLRGNYFTNCYWWLFFSLSFFSEKERKNFKRNSIFPMSCHFSFHIQTGNWIFWYDLLYVF